MRLDWQAKKKETTAIEAQNIIQSQTGLKQNQPMEEMPTTQVGINIVNKENGLEVGTSC